jgi:glyoxylase-like metal-dependent hydrolase (beta-lactamase superfamily II)/8-oxo-dGTP pyrophosphatase MutT (NUDIX family)
MERVAAAVVLCRGTGSDREVYLAHRAPQLRFFGDYLAMPGGVRGAEDGPDDPDGGDSTALRNCAVRELFEETGVLLDPGMRGVAASRRSGLRKAMLGDDKEAATRAWAELRELADDRIALREVCRIRTPPFAPVRYDTVFFLAQLPEGEEPEIWPGELIDGGFQSAEAALDLWIRGEQRVVPPVIVLLQRLRNGDVDRFVAEAASMAEGFRRGKLHRVWFSPGILLAPLETPTLPPATTTNCYIVGTDRLFVIDPGTPDKTEQGRLFDLLDELQAEGSTVDSVVCTHHHPDHVGAVGAVSRRYDVPVRGHPVTMERLDQDIQGVVLVSDGDRIELGRAPDGTEDWHLTAIFTPGHDRGHLAFRESRYGALIAGDMISTLATIMIDPPEGHMQTYLDSLHRLTKEEITTLYPAHGPAVPNGVAVIERLIKHRKQRQAALETALAKGPNTIEGLLPIVYWDVKEDMYPYASRSLLAGLQMMQEAGCATLDGDTWRPV